MTAITPTLAAESTPLAALVIESKPESAKMKYAFYFWKKYGMPEIHHTHQRKVF